MFPAFVFKDYLYTVKYSFSMVRKKHLINVHTSTGTTAPSGASLYLGEIAVQHTSGSPALWIKMGATEESTDYEKFIGQTEILNIVEGSKILGPEYIYSGLPYINSSTTIADAFSALTNEMIKDEKVVGTALNDLNQKVEELSGDTSSFSAALRELSDRVTSAETENEENEELLAGTLNNLNDRIGTVETRMTGEYITIDGYQLATGTTEQELALDETDTVNDAFGKLQKQMLDNERAVAGGLNELNERVEVLETETGASASVLELSAATVSLSGQVATISAKTSGVLTVNVNGTEQGKYSPSANTTIDLEIIQEVTGADVLLTGYLLASGTTEEELAITPLDTVNQAFGKLQKQNYDNESVVAGSINDLNDRLLTVETDIVSAISAYTMVEALSAAVVFNSEVVDEFSGAVMAKEYVIAQTLNSLNDKIGVVSGNAANYFDGAEYVSSAKTIIFTNGGVVKDSIDATDFIKDGMVSAVTVTGGNMVITFNTDAGHEDISIPLTDIFDPNLYYTKTEINTGVSASTAALSAATIAISATTSALSQSLDALSGSISNKEFVIAASINDLNDRLSGVEGEIVSGNSAYTMVNDLSAATVSLSAATVALSAETASLLVFDNEPTSGSTNLLNSGTIYNALKDVDKLGSSYTYSGISYVNSSTTIPDAYSALTNELVKDERTISTALNDLDDRVDGFSDSLAAVSAQTAGHIGNSVIHVTSTEKTSWTTGANKAASAYTAVTALSATTSALSDSITSVSAAVDTLAITWNDKEYVIAQSLNSLNDRVDALSGNTELYELSGVTVELSAATVGKISELSAGTAGELVKRNHNIPYVLQDGDVYTGSNANYVATTSELSSVVDGQSIIFHPKQSSTTASTYSSSTCSLKLVLADGSDFGPYPIFLYNNTKVTSHIRGTSDIKLTYHENMSGSGATGLNGWWVDFYYDSNTTYYLNGFGAITADDAIPRYTLSMQTSAGTWNSITTNGVTAATSSATTKGFVLGSDVVYYDRANGIASGAVGYSGSGYIAFYHIDFRYSSNALDTLIYGLPIYLVGTVNQTDKLFYLDQTTWWTQTLPTSEDGKVYIYLGSAASARALSLHNEHPIYEYKNGHIRLYQEDSTEALGAHSAITIAGGSSTQMHLPAVTSSDNGKILQVTNGTWGLVNPVTVYNGSANPSPSLGNDGDIYFQTS